MGKKKKKKYSCSLYTYQTAGFLLSCFKKEKYNKSKVIKKEEVCNKYHSQQYGCKQIYFTLLF